MEKLKCPKCENEELKGTENYCPICGLNLKEKTTLRELAQAQLVEINTGSQTINQIREELGLEAIEGGDIKSVSKKVSKGISENNKKFFDSIADCGERLINEKEYEVATKILDGLIGIKVIRATSILNLCNKAIQHSLISFQMNKKYQPH